MRRYCLDTSAYSRFQRGDEAAVEAIDGAAWIGVPAIVIGELRVGVALGSRPAVNEAILAEFLAHPVVEVLGVDGEVSEHYRDIVIDLRRRGTPIPTNDIWIAATAARHGVPVLTADDHFEAIARVGTVLLARR
jgi:tRNA(fMet)-specific endonuclease VapC